MRKQIALPQTQKHSRVLVLLSFSHEADEQPEESGAAFLQVQAKCIVPAPWGYLTLIYKRDCYNSECLCIFCL